MEGLDKGAIAIQCWYRRLMAQFQAKGRAKLREMAANGVTELYIKDMPYGTSLIDVPGGIVINLNEEDIEIGDEIITSDEEEEEEAPFDADPWIEKYASEDVKEAISVEKEADELELIPESDDDELSDIENRLIYKHRSMLNKEFYYLWHNRQPSVHDWSAADRDVCGTSLGRLHAETHTQRFASPRLCHTRHSPQRT